jgi:hypothetical protein
MARGRMAGIRSRRQNLQHRQREAGGLAGAGLRGAEQIAAREHDRNRLRLDGGGLGIALLGDCAEQLGRKAEILERGTNNDLLISACESSWLSKPVQADALR